MLHFWTYTVLTNSIGRWNCSTHKLKQLKETTNREFLLEIFDISHVFVIIATNTTEMARRFMADEILQDVIADNDSNDEDFIDEVHTSFANICSDMDVVRKTKVTCLTAYLRLKKVVIVNLYLRFLHIADHTKAVARGEPGCD